MRGFSGFPQKGRLIRVPGLFFSELLPQIDSLNELKVTLYFFWRMHYKESHSVYLWEREIMKDKTFLAGLDVNDARQQTALRDGLERSVARGAILQARVEREGKSENLYFLNTARGRAMAEGIAEGKWQPTDDPAGRIVDIQIERPTIFTFYEQNIGPLTPLLAERLQEIEKEYPIGWFEDAVSIAVTRNKRNLAYIEAILKRWRAEGHDHDQGQEQDWTRFIRGKYKDEIDH